MVDELTPERRHLCVQLRLLVDGVRLDQAGWPGDPSQRFEWHRAADVADEVLLELRGDTGAATPWREFARSVSGLITAALCTRDDPDAPERVRSARAALPGDQPRSVVCQETETLDKSRLGQPLDW
jgi:hypothetical protein